MRLATRTGLASFVAASITLLAVGSLFRGYFATVLQDRVDNQLQERAETAPKCLEMFESSRTVTPCLPPGCAVNRRPHVWRLQTLKAGAAPWSPRRGRRD